MRAVIRSLITPDAPSLEEYEPEDGEDFCLFVQVLAGPACSEGEESFNVQVVTPKFLAARVEREGPVVGRHLLVVNSYDAAQIRSWLERAVGRCSGNDWNEVAEKLSRIGYWEFEDYREA